MSEDKTQVQNPAAAISIPNREGVPISVVSNPGVSKFVRSSHEEVSVPVSLQGYIQADKVAKLPAVHGMQPTPANLGDLESVRGDLIPIEQLRESSEGSAEIGSADSARVRRRQLDRAA